MTDVASKKPNTQTTHAALSKTIKTSSSFSSTKPELSKNGGGKTATGSKSYSAASSITNNKTGAKHSKGAISTILSKSKVTIELTY